MDVAFVPSSVAASPLIPSLPNLRDIGGARTRGGGMVRVGLLYRSTELSRLSDADARAFARLGIRFIYDLRTPEERAMQPDRTPKRAERVVLDVLAGSPEASPARLMELLSDPRTASAALGGGESATIFERKYREFVALESARAAYARLFSDIASEAHRPALVHCTTGKDRTGWAVAALLLLLDVPEDAILADYLRSNAVVVPMVRPMLERFATAGGDPEVLLPLVEVRPSYLAAAYDEMHRRYGSVEAYFAIGLRLPGPLVERLRSAFIDRA